MPERVLLLGCVRGKRSEPAPAAELYDSVLWRKRRAYAEASAEPWLILSAEHGLLSPATVIAPYDLALSDLPAAARRAWGETTVAALRGHLGALRGVAFELHAGRLYRDAVEPGIRTAGGTVESPLEGLFIGQQLAWYGTAEAVAPLGRFRRTSPREVSTDARCHGGSCKRDVSELAST